MTPPSPCGSSGDPNRKFAHSGTERIRSRAYALNLVQTPGTLDLDAARLCSSFASLCLGPVIFYVKLPKLSHLAASPWVFDEKMVPEASNER